MHAKLAFLIHRSTPTARMISTLGQLNVGAMLFAASQFTTFGTHYLLIIRTRWLPPARVAGAQLTESDELVRDVVTGPHQHYARRNLCWHDLIRSFEPTIITDGVRIPHWIKIIIHCRGIILMRLLIARFSTILVARFALIIFLKCGR